MAMDRHEIAQAITQLRVNRRMTRKQVAKGIGCRKEMIWHWESGRIVPTVERLFAICEYFGVSVDETFGLCTPDKEECST